jgi:hypothetical protein
MLKPVKHGLVIRSLGQQCTRICCFHVWTSRRPFLQRWLTKSYRQKPPVVHGAAWVVWQSLLRSPLAVLAGVRLYNQDEIAGVELAQQSSQPANVAMPQVKGPAVLAGYNESSDATGPMASGVLQGQPGWHDQRLPGYLRQHAQQAALKGTESALPYARAASLENR